MSWLGISGCSEASIVTTAEQMKTYRHRETQTSSTDVAGKDLAVPLSHDVGVMLCSEV